MTVVVADVLFDFGYKFFDAPKGSSPYRSLCDEVEPDFNLVKPGRIGWRVVHMPTLMKGQPSLYPWVLVCGIVVDHQMNIELGWDAFLYMPEKAQVFLMSVAGLALGDDVAVGDVQSRKECCRAMPLVVVSDSLDVPQTHRQHGLSALQGLDLALLVDTQHHGVFGWAQVEADDVTHFFNKKRVRRELELSLAVRLQTKSLPDSMDAGVREARFPRDTADRPMGAVLGNGLKGLAHQEGNLLV